MWKRGWRAIVNISKKLMKQKIYSTVIWTCSYGVHAGQARILSIVPGYRPRNASVLASAVSCTMCDDGDYHLRTLGSKIGVPSEFFWTVSSRLLQETSVDTRRPMFFFEARIVPSASFCEKGQNEGPNTDRFVPTVLLQVGSAYGSAAIEKCSGDERHWKNSSRTPR
jgi:hypothetical protein